MPIQTVIDALHLPATALVEQRIAKKLLAEQGAPTAADRRLVNEAVELLTWHAALKPATVGVAAYPGDAGAAGERDASAVAPVIELAVLSVLLRPDVRPSQAQRLAQLIHRAVPYPLLLVVAQGEGVNVVLADERASLGAGGKMVLEALHESGAFSPLAPEPVERDYLASLALERQPRLHLRALYRGWVGCAIALQAARVTGVYAAPASEAGATAQRDALQTVRQLRAEMVAARAQALKEKQINRRVELNLRLQRLQQQLTQAQARLTP